MYLRSFTVFDIYRVTIAGDPEVGTLRQDKFSGSGVGGSFVYFVGSI